MISFKYIIYLLREALLILKKYIIIILFYENFNI